MGAEGESNRQNGIARGSCRARRSLYYCVSFSSSPNTFACRQKHRPPRPRSRRADRPRRRAKARASAPLATPSAPAVPGSLTATTRRPRSHPCQKRRRAWGRDLAWGLARGALGANALHWKLMCSGAERLGSVRRRKERRVGGASRSARARRSGANTPGGPSPWAKHHPTTLCVGCPSDSAMAQRRRHAEGVPKRLGTHR